MLASQSTHFIFSAFRHILESSLVSRRLTIPIHSVVEDVVLAAGHLSDTLRRESVQDGRFRHQVLISSHVLQLFPFTPLLKRRIIHLLMRADYGIAIIAPLAPLTHLHEAGRLLQPLVRVVGVVGLGADKGAVGPPRFYVVRGQAHLRASESQLILQPLPAYMLSAEVHVSAIIGHLHMIATQLLVGRSREGQPCSSNSADLP